MTTFLPNPTMNYFFCAYVMDQDLMFEFTQSPFALSEALFLNLSSSLSEFSHTLPHLLYHEATVHCTSVHDYLHSYHHC